MNTDWRQSMRNRNDESSPSLGNKLLRGQLAQDITWLYFIHFLSYLVPLLMIPYLARILGVEGWGILAFVLSFAGFVGLITEYGFYVSAQREAARHQHDSQALSRLFGEVFSAKLFIGGVVVAVSLVASRFIPILNANRRLLFGALFFGVTQGLSLTWYFRGIQRIKLAAGMEAVSKVVGAVLIVILITSPTDTWKYFYAFGAAQLGVLIWGFWCASRNITLRIPAVQDSIKALRDGGPIFVLHVVGSAFSISNVFILGLLAPPQIVGYFAGAEKIVRFLASTLEPVRNAMFPRQSNLVQSRPQEAREQLKRVLIGTGVTGAIMGCLVFLFAPRLVTLILGNDFYPAINSLKVLAPLVPILTLANGLALLWLLPRGFERKCLLIISGAWLINLVLALLLVRPAQHTGMAIAVLTAELLVVIGYWATVWRDKG